MKKNKRFFFLFLLTSILAFYFAYILYSLLYKKSKPELSLQMLSVFLKEPNFKYYVVICETMTLPILLRMSLMPNLDINEAHHGSSKWENEKDFKKRVYTWDFKEKPKNGGIFLGAKLNKSKKPIEAYYDTEDVHNLIIAATRTGKTRRLLLQSVFQISVAGESMVINDPKGEIYLMTSDYLKSIGYHVICIDFREPLKSNYWNPIHMIQRYFNQGNSSLAIECAWDLASIISPSNILDSDKNIFSAGSQSILAGAIILLCMESKNEDEKNMSSLNELIHQLSDDKSLYSLDNVVRNLSIKHPARKAFYTAFAAKANLRTSMFSNALSSLRLFTDSNIETMTSKQDHEMESVGQEKTVVFSIVPDEKTTRHPLATIYMTQLYQALIKVANSYGGRLPINTHFLYDEFGNSPIIPDFPQKITVGGGRGIRYTLVVQSLEQLEIYGVHGSNTIKGNCHNWLYLSTNNPNTAKIIKERVGTETILTSALTFDDVFDYMPREQVSMIERDLKTTDEILKWDKSLVLVMTQGQQPSKNYVIDFSVYPFNKWCNLKGKQEVDKQILMHRDNMRMQHSVIEPKVWNIDIPIKKSEKPKQDNKENSADVLAQALLRVVQKYEDKKNE